MNKACIETMIQHDYWASMRLFDLVSANPNISDKSKQVFNHLIGAQHTWICRIKEEIPLLSVFPELPVDAWGTLLKQHWLDFMEMAENDAELDRVIVYKNTKGEEFSNTIEQILLHVMMHSQYHRGQIIAYSRDVIESPPATDLIAYYRTQK
jgi:uncharacterized damage-inducible protein DinB